MGCEDGDGFVTDWVKGGWFRACGEIGIFVW